MKAGAPTGTARHRGVGLALIGMAAFLLVLAPMLRWYAYPRLAVVPADVDGTLVSVGDATVFDIDDRAERRTDLTSIRTVRSDVSTGAGEVAVWDTFVKTMDAEGTTVSAQTERAAFDPHTGVALPGFGENVDGDPVEHVGQVFKFPFGTEKRTYEFFDPTWPRHGQRSTKARTRSTASWSTGSSSPSSRWRTPPSRFRGRS